MAFSRNAGFTSAIATDAGATAAGYLTPARYNLPHTVTDAVSGAIPYFDSTTSEAVSALLAANAVVLGGGAGAAPFTSSKLSEGSAAGQGLILAAGTATTDVNALSITQTWNNASVRFSALKVRVTDTAKAADSHLLDLGTVANGRVLAITSQSGVPELWSDSGNIIFNSQGISGRKSHFYSYNGVCNTVSTGNIGFSSSSTVASGTSDAAMLRGGSNNLVFATDGGGAGGAGLATSRAEINKAVTAFTDGVAKTVFTLTIPNAAHSASYLVRVTGSIGAGGAIGANEASATSCYVVTLTRTAGVNAVGGISAAFGASTAAVAGATTVTCTAALAAVSGAVGATNTIDIQATITKGGGASDNHTCVATASLLNANASGITIA